MDERGGSCRREFFTPTRELLAIAAPRRSLAGCKPIFERFAGDLKRAAERPVFQRRCCGGSSRVLS